MTLLVIAIVIASLVVSRQRWQNPWDTEGAQRRAGAAGEAAVARSLRRLGPNFVVWNDVQVRVGRRSSQIDHVIWTPYGLWLLETKTWAGELLVQSDQCWEQRTRHTKKSLHSPEAQAQYHEDVVRALFRQQGRPIPPIRSCIVLAHPHSWLKGATTFPCVPLRHLRRWIRRETGQWAHTLSPLATMGPAEMLYQILSSAR